MTSGTSSPTPTSALIEAAKACLTSTEYNDVTGCITVNAVDALMAIANAINRLATVQEQIEERRRDLRDEVKQVVDDLRALSASIDTGPGHA
jgi:hypothetical protein